MQTIQKMNPLSPWLYLRRNPGMVVGTGLFSSAMVFLCVATLTIIEGFTSSALQPFEQLRHFSLIVQEGDPGAAAHQRQQIASHAAVQRVHEARVVPVPIETLFRQLALNVMAVPTGAHSSLIAQVGNRLKEGRLPRKDAAEFVIHERVVDAYRLTLGKKLMPLGFRLVGVISGPTLMGLLPLEYLKSEEFPHGKTLERHYLVLPKAQRRLEMNRFLGRLSGVTVYSFERARSTLRRNTRGAVRVLHFIAILLFVLASLIFGIVFKVFFEERQDELALLMALGFSPRKVLLRSLAEGVVISVAAWLTGVLAGLAALAGLQRWVFGPRGLEFPVFAGAPLWISTLLPLTALLVTLITIRGVFRRLDPVALIDRRR